MAIISFPSSPSTNQTFTVGSKTWIYNGYAWDLQLSSSGFSTANGTIAWNTANAAFIAANAATATDTTQNNSIIAAFTAANSAGVYANGAFAKANTQDAINLTQNNSITAAFAAANAATATDTTQNNSITAAFAAANTATATNLTQNNSITAAFTRANNSLDANNGGTVTGTITATSFITTGTYGNILGANVIYANTFIANTGFIQFADGSKQYTANAGSGGGSTSNSFGQIVANGGTILATTSNDSLQIVGESGITVTSNISAKKVVVSVPAGYTFTTADYGFVYEDTNVIYDYGTL